LFCGKEDRVEASPWGARIEEGALAQLLLPPLLPPLLPLLLLQKPVLLLMLLLPSAISPRGPLGLLRCGGGGG
jgi:hypothetical protein